jgi:hypothetical protein
MKRIVYSPKVYVFVKADTGIYDLTEHVVDCSVTRKVNEVSSASVSFRNPDKMFTNGEDGPIFHPMDPITIFMKRLDGRPVQVFTGYCDSTPYFQLKPSIATITASCTLKRLLYTYWDPGLPFVQEMLAQRGWSMVGQEGGLGIANFNANQQNDNDDNNNDNQDQNQNQDNQNLPEVSDGSIGALLFDILLYIGNWDPSTIFIEPIPAGIYETAETLIAESNLVNKQAREEFNKLLKYIIGEDGYGGTTTPGANPDMQGGLNEGLVQFAELVSAGTGLQSAVVVAWGMAEGGHVHNDAQYNYLNIKETPSTYKNYNSIQASANDTIQTLNPPYSGGVSYKIIKDSVGKSGEDQIKAIASSMWLTGNEQFNEQYYNDILSIYQNQVLKN